MLFHVLRLPELQVAFKKIVRKTDRVNNPDFFRLLFLFFASFFEAFFPVVVRTRFFHGKKSETLPNKSKDRFRFENFKLFLLLRKVELSRILVEIEPILYFKSQDLITSSLPSKLILKKIKINSINL